MACGGRRGGLPSLSAEPRHPSAIGRHEKVLNAKASRPALQFLQGPSGCPLEGGLGRVGVEAGTDQGTDQGMDQAGTLAVDVGKGCGYSIHVSRRAA